MTTPLACVIPALDAAATLPAVARGLREALPRSVLIVVDDGSRDGTLAAARAAGDVVVPLHQNRGKGAALRAGIAVALAGGAAAVLTIDADGQHAPHFAGRLVAALDRADVVIGARDRTAGSMPWRRRVTNSLASRAITSITGRDLADTQSGYRAMRRSVLEHVAADGDRYDYETDFLIRAVLAGFSVVGVPVPTIYGARSHFRSLTDSVRVVRAIWRHRASARR